jgi:DNA-binding transcriptional MerR regulator
MFTIGDFARHGRVSVRMLRHYDATGLLRPASVDPASSYRFYAASQLAQLNRIVALKDLGFTLEQVRVMVEEQLSVEELHGMLRLRRAQLQSQIATDSSRLAQVEARLRIIEMEGTMPDQDVQIKKIPAVRVAELSAPAASLEPDSITPVIRPLYGELGRRLGEAGLTPAGPGVAYYVDAPDGDGVLVHASVPVNADLDTGAEHGVQIVDLPEIGQAATVVHHGSMDNVLATIQVLARWIDENGYRSAGYPRELYLECPEDQDQWVTELQEPVTRS